MTAPTPADVITAQIEAAAAKRLNAFLSDLLERSGWTWLQSLAGSLGIVWGGSAAGLAHLSALDSTQKVAVSAAGGAAAALLAVVKNLVRGAWQSHKAKAATVVSAAVIAAGDAALADLTNRLNAAGQAAQVAAPSIFPAVASSGAHALPES